MKCQNRKFTKFISLLKFPGLQYHFTMIHVVVHAHVHVATKGVRINPRIISKRLTCRSRSFYLDKGVRTSTALNKSQLSQSREMQRYSGLEKSAAIRPFATKKSRLASEKILLADSLATESCRLGDRLATKLFFKADNADADRT